MAKAQSPVVKIFYHGVLRVRLQSADLVLHVAVLNITNSVRYFAARLFVH